MLEAGEAFGATGRQLLWKVELPHAMPTIMAGLTQCIMLSLSMVVIAALVGAGGLGKPVVRALNTVNIAQGFEAGLAIVLVAILLDRVCKQRERREAWRRPGAEQRAGQSRSISATSTSSSGRSPSGRWSFSTGATSARRSSSETGHVIGVADATVAIEEGEICVLMGLSGSGKSTLLRCVNGLNKATRGEVLVDDRERPGRRHPLRSGDAPAPAHPAHRDGVPAVRAAALAHGRRERRLRAGAARHGRSPSATRWSPTS